MRFFVVSTLALGANLVVLHFLVTLGLDESLDDGRRPVDKEVFMRELDYYEIRSGSK